MRKYINVVLFTLAINIGAFCQQYAAKNIDASFISAAPLQTFEGTSSYLQGIIDTEKNILDFFLDLNTLKTGIELRDKHMRKNYLETHKFPYAEFTGSFINLPTLAASWKPVAVKGTFKVHGVEKSVTIEGKVRLVEQTVEIEAEWKINLSDYKIDIPKVVFYELSEEITIKLSGKLTEKK